MPADVAIPMENHRLIKQTICKKPLNLVNEFTLINFLLFVLYSNLALQESLFERKHYV